MADIHLLTPADIRSLADELGVQPTKRLGQNFLHDANTVRKIVAAAEISSTDDVVEVGPGLGSLTLGLLAAARSVTCVEIDPRLAQRLPETVATFAPDVANKLTVITADALTVTDLPTPPTALVANLPYNVAVPVILHFLATFPSLTTVLVMVQKEVADRLAARPGTKVYGVPSVKAAYYGEVSAAGTVGTHVFWPRPNVTSGLVRITVNRRGTWGDVDREQVFSLVDAAFASRRKSLRAGLAGFFGSPAAAQSHLIEAGIDPQARGEQLSIAAFVELARTIAAH
ncbi:MAG: 16S rRNA (adenine(1518)-N(6)/adenine(1519)-N(6))-dimethyltransferase RsmA [Corynebacterium sp.]|nr:16S rRNA (adenine(1518)-N(6)/adenine(1519)-N(6))-dimethyltransferase RsmA [Corynebacterium sp.]